MTFYRYEGARTAEDLAEFINSEGGNILFLVNLQNVDLMKTLLVVLE